MSLRFKLNKEDLIKIVKGAAIAGVGAAGVYGLEGLGSLDFGLWTPVATALLAVLANIVRKWLAEKK